MKRGIVFSLIMILLLSACGQRPAEDTTVPETTQTSEITEAPTEETVPETTEPVSRAQEILDGMTPEEKVYQLFIVTQEQLTGVGQVVQSGETTRAAIEKYPVGGIIYFASNILDPQQCRDMISGVQSYSRLPLFIAVDEEGGMVARVGGNPAMGTTEFPNMGYIQSPEEAYHVGKTIGADIGQFGFNLDFAPVADVNSNPNNPVIGRRAFSADPEVAAELVAAAVEGFQSSNMLCTLKHFPGHGDTGADSHLGYTELDKGLDALRQVEFLPFIAGTQAGAPFVMVGHLSVPQVTGDDLPATLSKTMLDILRQEIGFQGLIVTDSMQMGAITENYTSAEAAVLAVQAGVDVLLMPQDLEAAARGLLDAVEKGRISQERIDESVRKILQTKLDSGILM